MLYFSRTGYTETVAERMADRCCADVEGKLECFVQPLEVPGPIQVQSSRSMKFASSIAPSLKLVSM